MEGKAIGEATGHENFECSLNSIGNGCPSDNFSFNLVHCYSYEDPLLQLIVAWAQDQKSLNENGF
jgi:hypothetical protein